MAGIPTVCVLRFRISDTQIPSSSLRCHFTDSGVHLQGTTHSVSGTGGMIILRQGLEAGTEFILENPRTQQKVEVKVVRPAQLNPSLVPRGRPTVLEHLFPARHELTHPRRMRHPERSEGSLFKSRTWFLLRTPVHANLAAIQGRAAQNLGAALLLRFVVTIER
jgi:hypothetical protein